MKRRAPGSAAGPGSWWAAILALALCVPAAAFSQSAAGREGAGTDGEARIALVIGNGGYPNAPLKNPANDARDMAAALQKVGFRVSLLVDADLGAMNRALRDFGAAIRQADAVALFYYSGHGVQYRGANYLIPARSDIQDADELAYSALNAEQIYAKMESAGAKTNIVILDACRNNPFPGSERAADRGLAVVGNVQPPQSLIVYATAPGKTAADGEGRNGVFTGALLRHLQDPNLDVELMIRRVREEVMAATGGAQVPWHSSSVSGEGFAFVRAPVAAPAAAPVSTDPSRTTGTLTLTSDPPGMQVAIDDGDYVEMPLSVELDPGSHSFEMQQTIIDGIFYAGQAKQWAAITAGSAIEVPLKAQVMTTSLAFPLVPRGYTVFVNRERVGVTPLGEITVKAGMLWVDFEKEGEPARALTINALPGRKNALAWGKTNATALQLERRPIRLDGKPESWAGIEPVYARQAASSSRFMMQDGAGIARVYMCRDDKNLFWRLDFDTANPLKKLLSGVKTTLLTMLSIKIEARKELNIGLTFDRQANRYFTWMGTWDEATATGTSLGSDVLSYNNGDTMLVLSTSLERVKKYCTGPVRCEVALAQDTRGKWEPGWIRTEGWYVDFSK